MYLKSWTDDMLALSKRAKLWVPCCPNVPPIIRYSLCPTFMERRKRCPRLAHNSQAQSITECCQAELVDWLLATKVE